jgi:type IV pilus assembly protein PilB
LRNVYYEPLKRKKVRLGEMLTAAHIISEEQLKIGLEEQKLRKQKLGVTLVDLGFVSENEIANILHTQLKIDLVFLSDKTIDDEIIQLISEPVLRKHSVMPFEYADNNPNVLRVAMADPMDIVAIDDLSIITNLQIEPFITVPREILAAIDRYYGNAEAMAVAERYTKEKEEQYEIVAEDEAYKDDVNNSPIVLLVNKVIEQSVRHRASDIHIEALENQIRVRYRVDGVLKEIMRYDINLLTAIVARIKIIGGMDISEKRRPQDGRITAMVDRQEYDIRVSILPTVFGEKIVMRLTSKQGLTKNKKDLGFTQEEMEKFDYILKNPHGIILVTGPTGSGKSTTLYTALSELNVEDVNIITVEDPVEANIDGINQVQVNVKAEMTFAAALRSILRQDPDIIMIGEIRDGETAEIAVKASITGHLVVSTLHTNSAASSLTRLVDMGVKPYLLADSVVGVIAQRLVRRLCPNCKKSRYANNIEKDILGMPNEEFLSVYEAAGCHQCNNTGYFGRIGVYEIMPITQRLKNVISRKGTVEEIKAVALEENMTTLRMSATKYVLDGTTTMDEMKRIAFENDSEQ